MATILVIEDHEESRRILRDLLASARYEMLEATTGEDGLRAATAHRPHAIVLDVQLPGLDGYEVTRRLKADPALQHIPIIVVTSYALSGDEAQAFAAGCDDYVAKPYDPMALLDKIRELAAPDRR
jgi:two-component system cell cycle response regulator DivK